MSEWEWGSDERPAWEMADIGSDLKALIALGEARGAGRPGINQDDLPDVGIYPEGGVILTEDER